MYSSLFDLFFFVLNRFSWSWLFPHVKPVIPRMVISLICERCLVSWFRGVGAVALPGAAHWPPALGSDLLYAATFAGYSSFTRACGSLQFCILVALVQASRMIGFLRFVDLLRRFSLDDVLHRSALNVVVNVVVPDFME